MKTEEIKNKLETSNLKFQSKAEIADCIRALGPFTNPDTKYNWAIEKIKELTKLL